ncbi:MAG: hypothetical protein GC171_13570 [Terrimonas sp.]|nr:hypothetical protein [Terrimonas sp.]
MEEIFLMPRIFSCKMAGLNETRHIANSFKDILEGEPWYGKPVYTILEEVEETSAEKTINPGDHTMMDLLRHMISWAGFTLSLLRQDKEKAAAYETLDWEKTGESQTRWADALRQFKDIHHAIIQDITTRENDDFLNDIAPLRTYSFRYLLQGLLQHNIYHAGQIAFIHKSLSHRSSAQ